MVLAQLGKDILIKFKKELVLKILLLYEAKKDIIKNYQKIFHLMKLIAGKMQLNLEPDIAIISNPSSSHIESALKISEYVKGIFIEKPLIKSSDSCRTIN